MKQLRKILVGVDFSDCSIIALEQAARLAQWNGAALHVLHVVSDLVVRDLAEAMQQPRDTVHAQAIEDARADLTSRLERVEGAADAVVEVTVGNPLHDMLDRTQQLEADLLVLGVWGASGRSEGAGTFAVKCVRKAKTKVMLVHGDHKGPFQRVVACVDFSETSRRALEHAAGVSACDQAVLNVVHVFEGPWRKLHYKSPSPESSPAFQQQYRDRLHAMLDDFAGPIVAAHEGLQSNSVLFEHHSYGRGIVEYARSEQADLVVLGTEGHANLRYMLLGSTAERVLRELTCSVLTIKPRRD